MKKQFFLTLMLAATALPAWSQSIPVGGLAGRSSLSLDYNRIWDYNLYEQSRWGVGGRLELYPKQALFNRINVDAYVAYGTLDKQWKGGVVGVEYFSNGHLLSAIYEGFAHDYFAVGSRRIASSVTDGSQLLGSFMARRMTRQDRALIGVQARTVSAEWTAAFAAGSRAMLFDNGGPLYLCQGDTTPRQRYVQLQLAVRHTSGLRAQIEVLQAQGLHSPTLRLLVEYNKLLNFKPLSLRLFAQAGTVTRGACYVDHFDLGGYNGSLLYFGQAFVTSYVNEFTASSFALFGTRLSTQKPLLDLYSTFASIGTCPTPFLAGKILWGHLWNQDDNGQAVVDAIDLQSPHMGLAEVSAGVDGILRWGAIDWGIALNYRFTTKDAPYSRANAKDNWAFTITANLHL